MAYLLSTAQTVKVVEFTETDAKVEYNGRLFVVPSAQLAFI